MAIKRLLWALCGLFLLATPAMAGPAPVLLGDIGLCDPWYPTRCVKVGADGTVPISGSVTAGAAFAPTGQASLAVTTTTARVALPAASANVTLVNTGAQTAYFLLGNGSVAATTATGYPLQSGSSITLAVGANTNVAAITSTSTTTLNVTSGTGVPALAGGGSTGGGGGGAVTVADGADVTQGALADAACATDNGTCTIEAVIKRGNQRLTTINTTLGTPFQAGGSIGNTTFASTQSGAWNITNITGTITLPALASTSTLQTTINTSINSYVGSKAAGTAATNSALTGCVYNSTPLTLTNGQQAATGCTVKGVALSTLADPTTGAPLDPTLASAVQCGTTTGTMVQCALDNTNGSTGSTAPTRAGLAGAKTGANMDALIQAGSSAAISVSTATTTQIVALSSSLKIYVTSFDVIAAGTGNITFVYGTGSNCGTGTTSLTGAYNLTAQNGIAKGNGLGPVLVVPASNALCVTTSAAVGMAGSVSYAQF